MKLLIVTHYFADHQGGPQISAQEIGRRMACAGHEVHWIASGPLKKKIEGIHYHRVKALNITEKKLGIPYPFWSPRGLWRLWKLIEWVDVVHLHETLYPSHLLTFVFSKLKNRRLVLTQYIDSIPYPNWILRQLMSSANYLFATQMLKHCDQSIFESERVRDAFMAKSKFRQTPLVLRNGVEKRLFYEVDTDRKKQLRQEYGLNPDAFYCFFAGRFIWKKGLHAIKKMANRHGDIRWLFAGYGPEDPSDWGLNHVRNFGQVDHEAMPALYQMADLVVLPSLGEGLPLVVEESMHCGVPVLISEDTAQNMPGLKKVTIQCKSSTENLEIQILKAKQRPSERAEISSRAKKFALKHWDWETCFPKIQDAIFP